MALDPTPSSSAPGRACVLLFSGGRDSTLAAVRLCQTGYRLTLATVLSPHLVDLGRVERRIKELSRHLPDETTWLTVRCAATEPDDSGLSPRTCLPCQRDYVTVGALLARTVGASAIALGYTEYQASWPEQSVESVALLRSALAPHGLELLVPVYSTRNKEEAESHLVAAGLTSTALEQVCLRQQFHLEIPKESLPQERVRWAAAIGARLARTSGAQVTVVTNRQLSTFKEAADA